MKFKIGDRVAYRPLAGNVDGVEAGAISTIAAGPINAQFGRVGYVVQGWTNGSDGWDERCLEKVLDREQTIPWSQCEWKPRDLNITV